MVAMQDILPNDCVVQLIAGAGILEVQCPSAARAKQVTRSSLPILAEMACVERIIIRSTDGEHQITASVSAILSLQRSKMHSTTNSNYKMQKLSEKVYGSSEPTALVSIETHKNIIFNDGVIALMGMAPAQLRSVDLRVYWRKPEEMNPSVLTSEQLPGQLEALLRELRQNSLLKNRRYSGWRGNQFGVWTATIEAVEMQAGEWGRLMTTHDFESIVE